MSIKKILIFFFTLIIFASNVNADTANLSEEFQSDLYVAEVVDIVEEKKYDDYTVQTVKIKLLSDKFDGEITEIKNSLTGNTNDLILSKGDKINVYHTEVDGEDSFYIHSFEKSNAIILLIIIFIIFVLLFGKLKGLKALISLGITIALILYVLVPLLLKGYNPIILSIIVCMLATVLTFVITNGFTKKSLIATTSVIGGLLVAGIIAFIFSNVMHLTGISGESEQMLYYIPGGIEFDFKGLLFAGILIGSLGACMDVAIELTSSLTEIISHNPKIEVKKLVESGFNIGKDIMGTMVNTLILAYTGSSLSTILLFVGFEKSFSEIINLESISIEILRALSGSIGLLFTIPITIGIFVFILGRDNKKCLEK